ncbi:hypothetical protein G4H71_02985 [Rhodococcus triatomae]|uniref:Uncharacterized protein n=1 Tax=Rhodococcus triatomae TaxID=300028 RepID=A0A1G8M4W9_9NOCA|nr:hypothetical protein [Rhodococcus triatomae]QNG18193.1 hypothetical protein G4H72_05055 [Rhodococcus triatomae]QNG22136.1 hypothetical protein G4H71_02985 [Rhodococcus triatomae]SDI63006.1 hypothetical protein SAMN05444695_109107 [Rhodococcus triatomae]
MADERPLLPSLDDDPAAALHLRKSLRTLAAVTPDPAFKKLVGEVLDGRADLRDVFDSQTFTGVVGPLVTGAVEELSALSDEEREALAEQGRQQIEDAYAAEKAAQASRDRAVDSSDDDDYFDDPPSILSTDW